MLIAEEKEAMRAERERNARVEQLDSFEAFIFFALKLVAFFVVLLIAATIYAQIFILKQNLKEKTHARIRSADKNQLEVSQN